MNDTLFYLWYDNLPTWQYSFLILTAWVACTALWAGLGIVMSPYPNAPFYITLRRVAIGLALAFVPMLNVAAIFFMVLLIMCYFFSIVWEWSGTIHLWPREVKAAKPVDLSKH
jgi:hypothetical protein